MLFSDFRILQRGAMGSMASQHYNREILAQVLELFPGLNVAYNTWGHCAKFKNYELPIKGDTGALRLAYPTKLLLHQRS